MRSDARKRLAERTPEPTAASSIDAETLAAWGQDAEFHDDALGVVAPVEHRRILALIAALRDEQQAREKAEGTVHFLLDQKDGLHKRIERAEATLAAVRAWAANPHGAKSELRKILGDES